MEDATPHPQYTDTEYPAFTREQLSNDCENSPEQAKTEVVKKKVKLHLRARRAVRPNILFFESLSF